MADRATGAKSNPQARTFVVEKILKRREKPKGDEYLIKWADYLSSYISWVPRTNIFDRSIVDEFDRESRVRRTQRRYVKARAQKQAPRQRDGQMVIPRPGSPPQRRPRMVPPLPTTRMTPRPIVRLAASCGPTLLSN
jgi:hypothetical protein